MTTTEHPNPPRSDAARRVTRWNTPLGRAVALSVFGVAAVTLAACGSSSSASTTSSTSASASTGGGSGGAGGGARTFPGASGTIAAINGASLEVQNAVTGQTTVTYTPTTTFDQTVSATASSVSVGSCVSAFGKPTSSSSSSSSTSTSAFGRPVTATTVSVSQPTSGSCAGGFGGRAFGGGTGRPPGGFPGGRRPAGAGGAGRFSGQFAAASGPVTAVNGSMVAVNETDPTTKKVSSVAVTLTSSTTFTERQTAAASDLAVGQCASAVGTADTTGAVTARSITISTPGANGCTTGFGRFGGAGGAGGGGGGAAGAVPGGATGA